MDLMRQLPDKYFELAIVDPPYGIGMDGGKIGGGVLAKQSVYTKKHWDKESPPKVYFEELKRVSQNQIIFGANHFISKMPFDSSSWIVWDKRNGNNSFADCELAWSSFNSAARIFRYRWAGMLQENMKEKEVKIHPTQKPVALYEWILSKYANPGDKILDTHVGSASSLIACHKGGFDFIGAELDKEYYAKAQERLSRAMSQIRFADLE